MLNLREAALRQGGAKSDCESILGSDSESISSLHFERIVGCFGGSLCPPILEGDEEDEENLELDGLDIKAGCGSENQPRASAPRQCDNTGSG